MPGDERVDPGDLAVRARREPVLEVDARPLDADRQLARRQVGRRQVAESPAERPVGVPCRRRRRGTTRADRSCRDHASAPGAASRGVAGRAPARGYLWQVAAKRPPTSSPACVAIPRPASRSSPTRPAARSWRCWRAIPIGRRSSRDRLGLARSTVTHHLRTLEAAGLVRLLAFTVEDRVRLYALDPDSTGRVIAWLAGTGIGVRMPARVAASEPEEHGAPAKRTSSCFDRPSNTQQTPSRAIRIGGSRGGRLLRRGRLATGGSRAADVRSRSKHLQVRRGWRPSARAACHAVGGRARRRRGRRDRPRTRRVLGGLTGSSQETGVEYAHGSHRTRPQPDRRARARRGRRAGDHRPAGDRPALHGLPGDDGRERPRRARGRRDARARTSSCST